MYMKNNLKSAKDGVANDWVFQATGTLMKVMVIGASILLLFSNIFDLYVYLLYCQASR